MTKWNLFIIILIVISPACSSLSSGNDIFTSVEVDSAHWKSTETASLRYADINWHNASPPFKRYILISDAQFLCAIRFVNFRRGRDSNPGSFWSSGEETLTSAYEWNVLEQVGNYVKIKESGKATVKFSAPKGFGHLIVAGGYGNVICGKRKFGWQYPAGIVFSQASNSSMRLAPTPWSTISQIRLDTPKLNWYTFDQNRKEVRIPINEL
jgi:hypothetical protein